VQGRARALGELDEQGGTARAGRDKGKPQPSQTTRGLISVISLSSHAIPHAPVTHLPHPTHAIDKWKAHSSKRRSELICNLLAHIVTLVQYSTVNTVRQHRRALMQYNIVHACMHLRPGRIFSNTVLFLRGMRCHSTVWQWQ
jgi:hypothetical protein